MTLLRYTLPTSQIAALALLTTLVALSLGVAHTAVATPTSNATPSTIVEDLVVALHGLPTENTTLSNAHNAAISVVPVTRWQIARIQSQNEFPGIAALFDRSPNFLLTIDIAVTYETGQSAMLRWKSLRPGRVLGPLMISRGQAINGEISVLWSQ